MHMSDAVLIAIVSGIPATLAPLTGVINALRNGRTMATVRDTTDTLTTGQSAIHELVNSNLTKIKNELAAAHAEIESLKLLVGQLREWKAAGLSYAPAAPEIKP